MGLSCLVELSELRLSGRVVLQPVKLLGALYKLRVMELTQDLQVGAVGKGGDEEEQGARARAAHGAHARYTGMPRGGGGGGLQMGSTPNIACSIGTPGAIGAQLVQLGSILGCWWGSIL
jgi:hypothetical protein